MRAWRSAQRLGAELDVLWVAEHEPNKSEREQLDALRRLACVLGAHLLVELLPGVDPRIVADPALRLAVAEEATLVPGFLARVSLDLRLDAPLPRQCSMAVPLLGAIEQRATESGVPVDPRIERGRNRRHALRQTIAPERFDRFVIAAASHGSPGFDAHEVARRLDSALGEIVIPPPQRTGGTPGRPLVV